MPLRGTCLFIHWDLSVFLGGLYSVFSCSSYREASMFLWGPLYLCSFILLTGDAFVLLTGGHLCFYRGPCILYSSYRETSVLIGGCFYSFILLTGGIYVLQGNLLYVL